MEQCSIQSGFRSTFQFSILILLLLLAPPAFSGECRIQAGPDFITGEATDVPLGRVMAILSEKTGYAIYLDERLDNTPATFSIPAGMTPGQAIQRIIRPHSYAITYVKTGENISRIRDVYIYKNGGPENVDFRVYPSKNVPGYSEARGQPSPGSSPSSANPARSVKTRKSVVKHHPKLKKDIFGAPRTQLRPRNRTPDFRPTVFEMRNAYRQVMVDREAHEARTRRTLRKQLKLDFENRRRMQRHARNRAIREMLEQRGGTNE